MKKVYDYCDVCIGKFTLKYAYLWWFLRHNKWIFREYQLLNQSNLDYMRVCVVNKSSMSEWNHKKLGSLSVMRHDLNIICLLALAIYLIFFSFFSYTMRRHNMTCELKWIEVGNSKTHQQQQGKKSENIIDIGICKQSWNIASNNRWSFIINQNVLALISRTGFLSNFKNFFCCFCSSCFLTHYSLSI